MKKIILKKKILNNIEHDRDRSNQLVQDIVEYLSANISGITGEDYSKIMLSASKLVEASQKSNEQIVKLLEISSRQKKKVTNTNSLSQEEIDQLIREPEVVELGER